MNTTAPFRSKSGRGLYFRFKHSRQTPTNKPLSYKSKPAYILAVEELAVQLANRNIDIYLAIIWIYASLII